MCCWLCFEYRVIERLGALPSELWRPFLSSTLARPTSNLKIADDTGCFLYSYTKYMRILWEWKCICARLVCEASFQMYLFGPVWLLGYPGRLLDDVVQVGALRPDEDTIIQLMNLARAHIFVCLLIVWLSEWDCLSYFHLTYSCSLLYARLPL